MFRQHINEMYLSGMLIFYLLSKETRLVKTSFKDCTERLNSFQIFKNVLKFVKRSKYLCALQANKQLLFKSIKEESNENDKRKLKKNIFKNKIVH
jgi:hypothetical protein